MGLAIFVGLLDDQRENDPEGYEYHQHQLQLVNTLLTESGLPPHSEPEDCEYWDAEMFGYSGLHYLRRVAAHLELRGSLPPPGVAQASEDPVLTEYCDVATGTARGLRRLFGKPKPRRLSFDHLILHSDAEGYYVPIEFQDVLFANNDELAGGMVGSSQRLLAECLRLRDALAIPEDIDPEADILWEAADAQGEGTGWQKYGVESFTCVRLLHAAQHSINERAVIVFS